MSAEVAQALANSLTGLTQGFGQFGQSTSTLVQSLNLFNGVATRLASALSEMPRNLSVTGQQQINVTFNGAEMLSKLEPALREFCEAKTADMIRAAFKQYLPDSGITLRERGDTAWFARCDATSECFDDTATTSRSP